MNSAEIDAFVKDNKLSVSQSYMAKAMLLSGMSQQAVLQRVKTMASSESVAEMQADSLSCPRCNNLMRLVTLSDNRQVKYCPNDRVCLPLRRK